VSGLVGSLLVGLSVLWILDLSIQEELIFASMLGLVTFFLFKYLTSKDDIIVSIDVSWKSCFVWMKDYFFVALCFFSIILVMLVHPISDSLYVNESGIPLANWIRAAAAVFLIAYAPGYIALQFIDRDHRLTRIESFALSYILSLFFTPLVSFLVFVFNLNFSQFYVPIQLGLIAFLSMILIFMRGKQQKNLVEMKNVDRKKLSIPFSYGTLILVWIVCFALITAYFIRDYPWPLSDNGYHLGFATRFSSGKFSGETSWYNPYLWYQIFLASFYTLSGLPSVNVYFPLIFLTIMPYITFYVMASAFFSQKNRKISILATFFTLTQGFGWIYALQLRLDSTSTKNLVELLFKAGYETLDVTRFNLGSISGFVLPLYVVGLPTLFMLIYLLQRSNLMDSTRLLLVSILAALGYLAHGGLELAFFALLLCASIFFIPQELMSRVKKLALSAIIGLGLAAGLLIVGGFELFPLNFLFFLIITLTTAIIFSFLRKTVKLRLRFPRIKYIFQKSGIIRLGIILFVFFYFLSFIVLGVAHFEESYINGPGLFYATPWFLFPLRLGIIGLLTLTFAVLWVRYGKCESGKEASFFVLMALFSFLLTQFAHYVIQNPTAGILRFELYIGPAVSVVAAVALVELTRKLWKNKQLISFLLALLVLFGMGSQLLMMEGFALHARVYFPQGFTSSVSADEVEALDYLRKNNTSNLNISIATPTTLSYTMLKWFGEVWQPQAAGSPILFSLKSPEHALSLLAHSRVKYIYMAQRDFAELAHTYPDGYMTHLLDYLPIAFKNNEVTIYGVPSISSPMPSNITLVIPRSDYFNKSELSYQYPLEMCALSQLRYDLNVEGAFDFHDYSTIALTQDSRDNEKFDDYFQWVKDGGRLVVLNTIYHGKFAELMSIKSDTASVIDGVENNRTSVTIPEINVNVTHSNDVDIKVLAVYAKGSHSVSAFAFQKTVGDGEIIYVEVAPYFSALQSADENSRRQLFMSARSLLTVLDMPFLEYFNENSIPFTYISSYPYFYGNATLSGNITVESNFFDFDEPAHIGFIDISQSALSHDDQNISNLNLSDVPVTDIRVNGFITASLSASQAETLPNSYGLITSLNLPQGFNLTLTLSNGTTLKLNVAKAELVNKSALSFDGVNDYVKVNRTDLLDVGTSDFTLEAWIKTTMQTDWGVIIGKEAGGANPGYHLSISNGYIEIYASGDYIIDDTTPVNDGQLHHVVATRNENNTLKIYVDGRLVKEATFGGASANVTNTQDLLIGRRNMAATAYFNGSINEVRIYNRALGLDEIQYSYLYSLPKVEDGLVSWWRMNEGMGNIIHDETDKNFSGEIDGAEWILRAETERSVFLITAQGGTLRFFNVSSNDVLLKTPLIITNGETSFSGNVFIKKSQATFENLLPNSPLTINGSSRFKIEYLDNPTLISHFSYEGTYTVPPSVTGSSWNEITSIPWNSVLNSPLTFILVIMMIGFMFLTFKKRNNN
jgi:hypothetical protein